MNFEEKIWYLKEQLNTLKGKETQLEQQRACLGQLFRQLKEELFPEGKSNSFDLQLQRLQNISLRMADQQKILSEKKRVFSLGKAFAFLPVFSLSAAVFSSFPVSPILLPIFSFSSACSLAIPLSLKVGPYFSKLYFEKVELRGYTPDTLNQAIGKVETAYQQKQTEYYNLRRKRSSLLIQLLDNQKKQKSIEILIKEWESNRFNNKALFHNSAVSFYQFCKQLQVSSPKVRRINHTRYRLLTD